MANPVIHALVFIAAVLIPGGLIVYFAWRAARTSLAERARKRKELAPDRVREAFLSRYPPLSLRARNRRDKLDKFRRAPRKKP